MSSTVLSTIRNRQHGRGSSYGCNRLLDMAPRGWSCYMQDLEALNNFKVLLSANLRTLLC